MKAIFIIDRDFMTIKEIPNVKPKYYFAIRKSRLSLLFDKIEDTQAQKITKMVFELTGEESINILGKLEHLPVYHFEYLEEE